MKSLADLKANRESEIAELRRKYAGASYAEAAQAIDERIDALRNEPSIVERLGCAQTPATCGADMCSRPVARLSTNWVPTAFALDVNGMRRGGVIGGVALSPAMQQAVVNPPSNSQYRLGTTALAAQRGNGIANSDAQRIDNLHNSNMQRFWLDNAQARASLARFGARLGPPQAHAEAFNPGARIVVLPEARTYYRLHSDANAPFGARCTYVSPQPYESRAAAASQLAMLPSFGNTMAFVSRYTVPAGSVVYEGTAAPQRHNGQYAPGGGAQAIFGPGQNSRVTVNSTKATGWDK